MTIVNALGVTNHCDHLLPISSSTKSKLHTLMFYMEPMTTVIIEVELWGVSTGYQNEISSHGQTDMQIELKFWCLMNKSNLEGSSYG